MGMEEDGNLKHEWEILKSKLQILVLPSTFLRITNKNITLKSQLASEYLKNKTISIMRKVRNEFFQKLPNG